MSVIYGVLRGGPDRWKREDLPASSKKSPHLQIRLLDNHGKPWRIPVNVKSSDSSLVILHRADPLVGHPILDHLGEIQPGLTDFKSVTRSAVNALDYARAPLFDLATGVALGPTGPGDDDDLQDVVSRYLSDLKAAGGELIAFGSHFHDPSIRPGIDAEFGTRDGMHDIHMNQGNPPGPFAGDNGVFNDGGLLLLFPDHVTGLFFRFLTEKLPTDNSGNQIPGVSREVPAGAALVDQPAPPTVDVVHPAFPPVYVERALVNPTGDDEGREVVVLGNTTTADVSLTGWHLEDKNGKMESLDRVSVPAGGSSQVRLSGQGAQFSNKGGTIRLLNARNVLVHAVSYSKADAVEGRFIRFAT